MSFYFGQNVILVLFETDKDNAIRVTIANAKFICEHDGYAYVMYGDKKVKANSSLVHKNTELALRYVILWFQKALKKYKEQGEM